MGLTVLDSCNVSLPCRLLWCSIACSAMLHSVIFIMAFPGEMIKSGSLFHHTKYFIFLMLNSMAAACLQFIQVMAAGPY